MPAAELYRAMEKAILVLSGKQAGDEDKVLRNFYDALRANKRYGKLIIEHEFSFETLRNIALRLRDVGLTWEKAYYMPIQIFSRVKPLRYVLDHSDELLEKKGHAAFLGAYNTLRGFFLQVLG